MWSRHQELSEADIQAALFQMPTESTGILGLELNEGFNIQNVIGEVVTYYIDRALTESQGNKTLAAQKLGLASYQTLKGWIKKSQIN